MMRVVIAVLAMFAASGCTLKSVPMLPNCDGMDELGCMKLMDAELTTFEGYDKMAHMEECDKPINLVELYDKGNLTFCTTPNAIPICADIMSDGNTLLRWIYSGLLPVGCAVSDASNGCDPQFADIYYSQNHETTGSMRLVAHELGHIKGFPDEWYVSGVEITYDRDKYIGVMCEEVNVYDN